MTSRRGLLLVLFGSIHAWSAEPYCSLTVRVLSPSGDRFPEVFVSVREASGRTVTSEESSRDVQFCDLGVSPVTVTVGTKGCETTATLPLYWQEPQLLTMLYDPRPCMRGHVRPSFCSVLLRISDDQDSWIEGAAVTWLMDDKRWRLQSDRAGRVLVELGIGKRAALTISADGYRSVQSIAECSAAKIVVEQRVRLRR